MTPNLPRRRSARRVLGGALAVLVSAPILAAITSGFRMETYGAPEGIAEQIPGFTMMMASDGGSLFVCPGGSLPAGAERTSRVARFAGYEGKPGGKPDLGDGTPVEKIPKNKPPPRQGEIPKRVQRVQVAKWTKFLKTLKGRFVPFGPKPWDTPKFTKVCVQVQLEAKQAANTKIINQCVEELRRISGKHPWIVKAKHDVAKFGWRKGMPCGVAVTLFGPPMYDFLERMNTIVLPRIRDFEGLQANAFDPRGNFAMRLPSQDVFPELDEMIDSRELIHDFAVGIVNNCFTQPDGVALMRKFGFPFRNGLQIRRKKRKAKKYVY